MIAAVGTDLCDIPRLRLAVERTGERFLRKVFTAREVRACSGARRMAELARRFAAKEATFKVLGRGWPADIGFTEIELLDEGGRPSLRLEGRARRHASALGIGRLHVAVADDGEAAIAVVVAERA